LKKVVFTGIFGRLGHLKNAITSKRKLSHGLYKLLSEYMKKRHLKDVLRYVGKVPAI